MRSFNLIKMIKPQQNYWPNEQGFCAGGELAFRLPTTTAQFINLSSLFILLIGFVRPADARQVFSLIPILFGADANKGCSFYGFKVFTTIVPLLLYLSNHRFSAA